MSDEMTFEEALERYKVTKFLASYAQDRFHEAKAAIADACIHPEEYRGIEHWHHGYGKYITSPMCKLCGAVDVWNRGKWTSAKDWNEALSNRHDD